MKKIINELHNKEMRCLEMYSLCQESDSKDFDYYHQLQSLIAPFNKSF